jgi:hypothetical protein
MNTRQGWLAVFFSVVLLSWPVHALAVPITSLFNSGVLADGTTLAAGGAVDLHYTLISSADATFPGPSAFVTSAIPGVYLANGPNSKWIAPDANQNFGPCCAVGNYTYRTTFDLTGLDPSSAVITGLWSTDNNGLDILINGVSTGQTTGFADFGAFTSFSITSGFAAGINTLDFSLNNGGGPSALRVEIVSATADQIGSVPEPSTLLALATGLVALGGMAWRRDRQSS